MTNWKKTVNIKPFIPEDDSDEAAQKCATSIRALLIENIIDYNYDFQTILDDLEAADNCEGVNYILSALYDWADANNVWLGL